MAESVIQLSKQANKIDGSLKQKAYTFLEKLAEDDTVPGLHVEPIKGSADPRVRTGRVDEQYRAVMFKVMNDSTCVYVIHGIYNHDEANTLAEKLTMTVNPINGLPDFNHGAPTSPAAAVPQHWELAAPSVREPLPLITFSAEDLTVGLGIPPEVAARAVGFTSEHSFGTWVENLPQWQGLALSCLASGESITVVAQELELLHQPVDATKAETAFELQEPASDQAIIEGFGRPASQMQFARIAGVDELKRAVLDSDFGAWRVFLHPQQRKWVERNWNGPFRLAGGAGTGKTVVAIHRARRLALDDPSACVVLTTFTTNLAQELVSSLRKLDPDVQLAAVLGEPGIHVKSIDALANGVLKGAGGDVADAVSKVLGVGRTDIGGRASSGIAWEAAINAAGSGLDEKLRKPTFLQSEYEMVVLPQAVTELSGYLAVQRAGRGVALSRRQRKAVWAVVESYRATARQTGRIDFAETSAIAAAHLRLTETHPAQHVLVDEGQDFTPCHWRLIRALVSDGPNDIFIAEDAHQRIYGQRLVLSAYDIATRGRSQRLRLNYRTTAQNLAWAEHVLAGEEYFDSEGDADPSDSYPSARSGPEPEVQPFKTLTDELNHAAELLQRWLDEGLAPETCAILVRDRATRERVVTGLSERAVTARSLDSGTVPAGKPVVLTMHRAKGTEFARVLLFGLSKDSVPMGLEAYEYDPSELAEAMLRERSLIYVAASRARDELVVSYSDAPSTLLSNSTKRPSEVEGIAASASDEEATPASEDEDAVDGSPESQMSQGLRPWLPSDAPPVAVDLPARVTESSGMPTDDLDADEWINWFQLLSEGYRSENRDRLMVEGLRAGLTLQAVGDLYDLTRERIRQIAGQQGVTMSVLRRQQREQRDRRWRRVARHIVGVSLSHPELTISELAEWAEADEATVKKALGRRVAVHQSSINSWSGPRASDAELLEALREWAAQTATHTGDDYTDWAQAKGLPGRQTVQMRFGGWNLALQKAGLHEHVLHRGGLRPVISNPEMWASVMQFFKEDLPSYSFNAYEDYAAEQGLVSGAAVRVRLGAWSAVKDRVRDLMRYAAYGDGSWEWGEEVLVVVPGGAPRNFVTREQAVDAITRVAEDIEGPITVVAYERARSPEDPHANFVQDRCGSWTNAVAEAGLTHRLSAKGFNKWSTGDYQAS